jgi:hypothetical protein
MSTASPWSMLLIAGAESQLSASRFPRALP